MAACIFFEPDMIILCRVPRKNSSSQNPVMTPIIMIVSINPGIVFILISESVTAFAVFSLSRSHNSMVFIDSGKAIDSFQPTI